MTPREGTLIADRYRLERKVGGGRVSAVWRVHDEVTESACALKLLHRTMHTHSEALTRFSLEERLARELTGPHFPERVSSGSWEGTRYIAWRWHDGECLRALFDRNPKQDAPTVLSIVQESCKALSQVHARGYTHGDVKPENLLFADRRENERTRQLKLIGFGVASRIVLPKAALGSLGARKPGQIVGTPLYLSPDLILGRAPRGGQADLWALAVIVYEALTGRPPFLGEDLESVLQAILDRQAPRPSQLTDHLPGSIDLWWTQSLEQAFSTPGEFATALARALAPALRTSHTQRSAALPERLTAGPDSPPPLAVASLGATAHGLPSLSSTSRSHGSPSLSSTAHGSPSLSSTSGSTSPSHGSPSLSSTAHGSPSLSSTSGSTSPSHGSPSPSAPPHGSPRSSTSSGLGSTSTTSSGLGAVQGSAHVSEPLLDVPALSVDAASSSVDAPASNAFAPLPSPLRDFASTGSRKTLVGITPPASLIPRALGSAPAAASLIETIEGAPCKPIDISRVAPNLDSGAGADGLRRPSNPTVPFPRPRFLPRTAQAEPDGDDTGNPESRSWAGTGSRTLRFVFTGSDHKPQRIAAAVVCVAAGLVIFAVGRSPVAGTGAIGPATGALAVEGAAPEASGSEPALTADPVEPHAQPSVAAKASESLEELTRTSDAPMHESRTHDARLAPDELAPGLVLPRSEPAPSSERSGLATPPSKPSASSSAVTPLPAAPDAAAPGAAGSAQPPQSNARAGSNKTPPRKPIPTPAPQRRPGDFDFGI
jgi:eukaryotic-like serine/threonine-protein kinase